MRGDPAPPAQRIRFLLVEPRQVGLDPLLEILRCVPRQHPLGEVPRRRRIRVRRRVRHVRVLPDPRVQAIHRRLLDPVLLRREFALALRPSPGTAAFSLPYLRRFPIAASRGFRARRRCLTAGGVFHYVLLAVVFPIRIVPVRF